MESQAMELLGGLGALAVLIVCAWIGGRMLLRSTGIDSPEFLLGASLFLGGVLALPLSMAGSHEGLETGLRVTLGTVGQLAVFVMATLQAAFVWLVFRRSEIWAKALVVVLGVGFLLLTVAQHQGAGMPAYFVEQRGALVWNHLLLQVMYVWASVESLGYYLRLRRQLRIGLGDPIAAERMLLWGLANACSAVSNGCIAISTIAFGFNALQSPLFVGWIGLLAMGSSYCLWRAFLAPASSLKPRHATPEEES
jgi:hypothetical protein